MPSDRLLAGARSARCHVGAAGARHPPLAQPLASWHEGPAKEAIVRFVERRQRARHGVFVAPDERIAVFDNDRHALARGADPSSWRSRSDRVRRRGDHPEWQDTEPFRSILAGDVRPRSPVAIKAVARDHRRQPLGMTTEASRRRSRPGSRRRATRASPALPGARLPAMLELLAYLRENGFRAYIVSGGGIDFIRALRSGCTGFPGAGESGPGKVVFELRDGPAVLVKLAQLGTSSMTRPASPCHPPAHRPAPDRRVRQLRRDCRCCSGRPPARARA